MTTLHHTIRIGAPLEQVWAVLADLEAVQHYNPMVARARYTSQTREGVGASRHCDFKPKGWGKERVIAWEPKEAIALELYESQWPIRFMRWRTVLKRDGSDTIVTQDLEYELKFGLLGKLLDTLMMKRNLDKGISDIFAGLKRFVETGRKQSEIG